MFIYQYDVGYTLRAFSATWMLLTCWGVNVRVCLLIPPPHPRPLVPGSVKRVIALTPVALTVTAHVGS